MFVLISSFVQGSHNLKYFSRCTSSQIVVCTEESANRIVQNKKSSFSNIIPLKGNLLSLTCSGQIITTKKNIDWDQELNLYL
jgi:hypothetical protein